MIENLNDYIYETVPDEHIKEGYDAERYIIFNFLKENQGEFFKARKIAAACGFPTRQTQVEVRKAITQLIEIDNKPIIASAKGFAIATNSHQLKFYAEKLEERKQGLQRRIDKVMFIYQNFRKNKNRCV